MTPSRRRLDEFLTEYKEKNTDNLYKPVAVGRYGIRKREDIYSKELAKDYSKNKLIFKDTLTIGMGSKQIDIGILSEDETYSVSPAYHTFRIAGIDADYLRLCLETRNADMSARYMIASARQGKTVDIKKWLKYEIPVASAEEQTEIVSHIRKIENTIDILDRQERLLDDAVKSRFIEMFGDLDSNSMGLPIMTLGQVLSVEPQNGFYKPQSYYVQDGSGTPILRVDAFYNGKVTDFRNLKRLICTEEERLLYLLKENDIIVNRVNGSIEHVGKCALIEGLIEDTVYESNMMRFHPDEMILNPVFLTNLLCTDYIRRQIKSTAKVANQCSVNQEDIKNLKIVVPPIGAQEQFADFVKATDKSKLAIKNIREKIEILKEATMQEYFG